MDSEVYQEAVVDYALGHMEFSKSEKRHFGYHQSESSFVVIMLLFFCIWEVIFYSPLAMAKLKRLSLWTF